MTSPGSSANFAGQPASIARGPRIRREFIEGDLRYGVAVTDCISGKPITRPPIWPLSFASRKTSPLLSGPAVLAIGLSRPCRGRPEDSPRHWLQVNNILV